MRLRQAFFPQTSRPYGRQVAQKALGAAEKVAHLDPNLDFIHNAAMLHDIGILHTKSPGLDCHGKYPYICHGFLGRELLDRIGLPEYGLISERHVGVGISSDDIRTFTLPLPERDMVPVSIEEQIICYADKFFSPYNPKTGSFSCSDLFAVKFQLPSLFLQGIWQA